MLTRIIAGARGFQRFAFTIDDELDAALILAGEIDVPAERRYCFQTVYLNEQWRDYHSLGPDQKLIWVMRNPYSVVFSMVYHWRRAALNRLYESCAPQNATWRQRRIGWPWPIGVSRMERACISYGVKTGQIEGIRDLVPAEQLLIVDYDEMVKAPAAWLQRIFTFIGAEYEAHHADRVRSDSVKKADRLGDNARRLIERYAEPVYRRCLPLVSSDVVT
jgi:hypothetical protein